MNEKVALFDFCETLVDFQTADAYVDFVRRKIRSRRMLRLETVQKTLNRVKFIKILEKLFPGHSINKRIKLFQLKGLSKDVLVKCAEEYYSQKIKPHFIGEMIDVMKSLKADGYYVGLVSGGYGIYLQYFCKEYGLDFLISSNIEINNNVCTGRFDGLDCMNENKTYLLNRTFNKIPDDSVAYSDSQTDIPFLQWAKKGVVVSREKTQKWSVNNNFEEIIWTKKD